MRIHRIFLNVEILNLLHLFRLLFTLLHDKRIKMSCTIYFQMESAAEDHFSSSLSLFSDLPVSISLPRRRFPMERLSDGGHAVGQAVQAPRVQSQTSVSHVAAKHNTTHHALAP